MEALFEHTPTAIGFSRDGIVLDANPAYVRLFGAKSAEELRGRPLLDQIAPSHRADILEKIRRRARGDPLPSTYETLGRRADGTEFPFEITTVRIMLEDGPLTVAFIADVSGRSTMTARLNEALELNRVILDAPTMGALVYRADGQCIFANAAACQVVGASHAQMLAQNFRQLKSWTTCGLLDAALRALDTGTDQFGLFHTRSTYGREIWIDCQLSTASRAGEVLLLLFFRDATEERVAKAALQASEDRLLQAQKLESLGILAGGVAHDFNNILTSISSNAELVGKALGPRAQCSANVEAIQSAVAAAGALCRQMLAYAGGARLVTSAIDLSALVKRMSSLVEASIDKQATLELELARDLPVVDGDETQIGQVLMNLILNASEALSGARGRLRVTTGADHWSAEALARLVVGERLAAGRFVWLEVEDSGCGMDAATRARVFDPFFTTKFTGRGLGMAAVLGIVRGHRGAIDLDTAPGRGTRIRVLFPASAARPAPRAEAARPEGPPRGSRRRVLVVDDEQNVRISTVRLLELSGLEVLSANDGVEALEVFGRHPDAIDVVLLDLMMPKLNGAEVLRALRELRPRVRVVLTTGGGTEQLRLLGDDAPDAVLSKPYTLEQLERALGEPAAGGD